MYAQVIDGEVVRVTADSPKNTARVSNFYLLTDAEKEEHGWYRVVDSGPGHDPLTQLLGEPVYAFEGDRVVSSCPVTDKTVPSLKRELIERGQLVAERKVRDGFSLQEQVAALANLTTPAHKTAVTTRINNVFGAFLQFREAVNSCTTLAELKSLWESHPEMH